MGVGVGVGVGVVGVYVYICIFIGARMGETRRGAAEWRQCIGGGGGA